MLGSLDLVLIEAWNSVRHGATSLKVVHLVAKAQNAANLVGPRSWQKLHQEDDVATIWDHNHGLLLADSIDDALHGLLG